MVKVKEQYVSVVVWDTMHVKMFPLYQHIGEDIVNTTRSALTKFNFRDLRLIQYPATFNNRDNNKNTTCIIIRDWKSTFDVFCSFITGIGVFFFLADHLLQTWSKPHTSEIHNKAA